jgi:catechol 2,3-dioxygenase-like lactoylglutathione lyase family enzyme
MKISKLSIYTSQLEEQIHFYSSILGLKLNDQKKDKVQFEIGNTELTLLRREGATPYHFAINIPGNKADEALDWLKARVFILKDGKNELVDFRSWNAQAIYFYDMDRNIVEFIARKDLKIEKQERFDQNQFLGISEIGMPVNDIETTFKNINALREIPVYDGSFDRFCAAGDETGLFIVIDKNKKKWYPTNDIAFSSDFTVEGDFDFSFVNGRVIRK